MNDSHVPWLSTHAEIFMELCNTAFVLRLITELKQAYNPPPNQPEHDRKQEGVDDPGARVPSSRKGLGVADPARARLGNQVDRVSRSVALVCRDTCS